MLKQRVMDDLDALLADLQSTTSHISNYQHQNHNSTGGTVTTTTHSASTTHESGHASPGLGYQSKESTPPPVPPPPSSDALDFTDNNLNIQEDPHYDSPAVVKQQYSTSKSSTSVTRTHSSGPAPPLQRAIQGVKSPPLIQRKTSPVFQHQQVNDGYDIVTPVSPHHQHRSPASPGQRRTPSPLPNQHKPVMSSLSNNLSELDSLLQDLSSAQFIAEVDRRNAENMTVHSNSNTPSADTTPVIAQKASQPERSVDSLLADLEHTISEPPQQWNNSAQGDSLYEQVQVRNLPPQAANANVNAHTHAQVMSSPGYGVVSDHGVPAQHMMNHSAMNASPGPASTATRELEDLMNSLSEFKVTSNRLQHVGDPPYAQPMKARQHANMKASQQHSPHMATVHGSGAVVSSGQVGGNQQQLQQDGGNLDSMLGTLNTDMSKQGITTVPKGHCALCMKPIVGQVITALGKIWHPEHFVCAHCDQQLGTQNFFERDNMPYCELDYHTLFSPKCAFCNGAILDKCVTALDKTWHPEHFFCATCHRQFGDDGFHEKDGKAYCRDDYYQLFAPKCGRCGHNIEDNYISALSRQWHPQCFSCAECNIPFGGGSFFDHEGLPYCETHYHARRGSLCASCHKPITGRCITAMYKKFHPEHFVCAFCLKQLNKGTFKEQNDKPYCHPCFTKLFG